MTSPLPTSDPIQAFDVADNGRVLALPSTEDRVLARRVMWSVADQAVSSFSNVGTGLVAARTLDRNGFGAFGLAFTVYVLAIGAVRALVTEPLVSAHGAAAPETLRRIIRAASGSAVALGLALSVVIAAAGALIGGESWQALGALALVLPGLALQDSWRYCFVTGRRPKSAFWNDAIWCGGQLVVLVLLLVTNRLTLVSVILWWGGCGFVAGLVGLVQAGTTPNLGSLRDWIRHHWELSARYLSEYAVAIASNQVTLLLLGAVAGFAALGAIRGALVYFGPLGVLYGGAFLALGGEGARLRSQPRRLRLLMEATSAVLVFTGVAYLLIGLALPGHVGRSLFGDTWVPARQVLIPVGLSVVGGCIAAGAIVGLRALAAARASLRARLLWLPLATGAPIVGLVGGVQGFAVGMALSWWLGAVIWWVQFLKALAKPAEWLVVEVESRDGT